MHYYKYDPIPHPFADKGTYQETRSSTNDARRRLPYTERRKNAAVVRGHTIGIVPKSSVYVPY